MAQPYVTILSALKVASSLYAGNLTNGQNVKSFEQKFSNYLGIKNTITVNSGTSALHLSLLINGIGKGDEVILPSFSFAATANAVKLAGAKPVFADIDPNNFCISISQVEQKLTKKTKAVLPVHLFGHPASMLELSKFCKSNDLVLIEDAAQAHGACIGDQMVGTFGTTAAFSFYSTKNMTMGEGGAIVTDSDAQDIHARLLRNQGMKKKYHNEIVGYNLRLTEFQAEIGIHQLRLLDKFNDKRINNAQIYNHNLKGFILPKATSNNIRHVYHQYTLRFKEEHRKDAIAYLNSKKIDSAVFYPIPIHKLNSFDDKITLKQTEQAAQQVLSIPVHPKLNNSNLEYIIHHLNKIKSYAYNS